MPERTPVMAMESVENSRSQASPRWPMYSGERITWKEADRRPPSDPDDPNHTFFFSLSDGKTVIDANVNGNAARWINHACGPNCEADEIDGLLIVSRVFDDRDANAIKQMALALRMPKALAKQSPLAKQMF